MDKGNCSACGRKIQKTTLNKCMYCGQGLQENQRFSEQELDNIREDKQRFRKELHQMNMERQKIVRQRENGGKDRDGYSPLDDFVSLETLSHGMDNFMK